MRRLAVVLFLGVLGAALVLQADTIKLKNGRVIQGRVAHFGSDEFIVEVPRADGGPPDRMILLVSSVESIEFGAAGTAAPGVPAASEKVVVLDNQQEVVATGLQLARGDKVLIRASGEMQFADGRATRPAGIESSEAFLPFPGERLGALVAMVGSPQSSLYHVIGEEAEFEARSDGELYLQINVRSLAGARGSYTARISAPAGGAASEPTGGTPTGSRSFRRDFELPADQPWLDTGIDLLEGETLRIVAEGTINYTTSNTCGPDGGERDWKDLLRALPVNDRGRGALIGKLGESGVVQAFFVGARAEFTAERAGRLFLGVNDDNYRDNSGSFKVRVRVNPPR